MASYTIVSWKTIPAVVEAQDGSESVTRELGERFQALIDSLAMQLGLESEDAYLEAWSRGEPEERPGSAREVADVVVAELEGRFSEFIDQAFRRSP